MRPRYVRAAIILLLFIFLYYIIVSQNNLSRIVQSEDDNKYAPQSHEKTVPGYGTDTQYFLNLSAVDRTSLTAKGDSFVLSGLPLPLISGAIHYFRMPREYWRDRLVKAKECGLNVVETYVPWNLHEPEPGKFDFSGMLDLKGFVLLAQDVGLLVIVRPGPYICSEWEFGGLPSWLLSDPDMRVRTMHGAYIKAVTRYFDQLLPIIYDLQYRKGGPVIAVQLDNEYGSYFKDSNYLPFLKIFLLKRGIDELMFLSDSLAGLGRQTIPDVLKTVNFKQVGANFVNLKRMQPDAPMMVMEFWTGWFDWWGEKHHTMPLGEFESNLDLIFKAGASVNFYMFYGGTNFGFMNGGFMNGRTYQSDITSYDYDALLTENGDLTPKFYAARRLISKYFNFKIPSTDIIEVPTKAYPPVQVQGRIPIWDVVDRVPSVAASSPVPMEMLTNVGGKQQSYGYILYRATLKAGATKSFLLSGFGSMNDRGAYYLNQHKQNALNGMNKHNTFKSVVAHDADDVILDVLVENGGRTNWETFDDQRKGLNGDVLANGEVIPLWTIYSFEMKPDFIEDLKTSAAALWRDISLEKMLQEPNFFKAVLHIDDDTEIVDTYLDMTGWGKGVAFVNGHNLGRYWMAGPQLTVYLPAPWLRRGDNDIVLFEESTMGGMVRFTDKPNIG